MSMLVEAETNCWLLLLTSIITGSITLTAAVPSLADGVNNTKLPQKSREWYWAADLVITIQLFFSLSKKTIATPTSLLPSLKVGKFCKVRILPVASNDYSGWSANTGFTVSIF